MGEQTYTEELANDTKQWKANIKTEEDNQYGQ